MAPNDTLQEQGLAEAMRTAFDAIMAAQDGPIVTAADGWNVVWQAIARGLLNHLSAHPGAFRVRVKVKDDECEGAVDAVNVEVGP